MGVAFAAVEGVAFAAVEGVAFAAVEGVAGKDRRPVVAVVASIVVLLAFCGGAFVALAVALR